MCYSAAPPAGRGGVQPVPVVWPSETALIQHDGREPLAMDASSGEDEEDGGMSSFLLHNLRVPAAPWGGPLRCRQLRGLQSSAYPGRVSGPIGLRLQHT